MKNFTTAEIRDLFGKVVMGEISFSQMTKVLNERISEEEKCVEDIPKRKFKKGDKVRIKDNISSKTSMSICFISPMDNFVGKELTVKGYRHGVYVFFNEDEDGYNFHEDWLELYVEELKKGDLAIFWDSSKECALVHIYWRTEGPFHYDSAGYSWKNAIKFKSKKQFKKLIKGKI